MTSFSKNMYIDKLDNIVNKYNNIYHKVIKMKPFFILIKKTSKNIINLKLKMTFEYQNIKAVFSKGYTSNDQQNV